MPALSTLIELSTDRVRTGISSLREGYANEAADVTSSSSALGLLAGRKQLHGIYYHPKSPAGSPRSWGLASVEAAGTLLCIIR